MTETRFERITREQAERQASRDDRMRQEERAKRKPRRSRRKANTDAPRDEDNWRDDLGESHD